MAAQNDTGNLTYYINGEPIYGINNTTVTDTGKLTYYINGEFFKYISSSINAINNSFFIVF